MVSANREWNVTIDCLGVQSWLYAGECDFSYKEFGLLMDSRYLTNRTGKAFCIILKDVEKQL